MNPTRAIKVYEEVCNKEIRCYKKWQAADQKKTGGYLGDKYKINDPKTKPYISDKITQVTPGQPFVKQKKATKDVQIENNVQKAF